MNRKYAAYIFLGVCVILAALLLTRAITPLVGCLIFAIGLVMTGLLSRGFIK